MTTIPGPPMPTRRTPPQATPEIVDALIAALADNPVDRRQWARAARVRLQQKEAARG